MKRLLALSAAVLFVLASPAHAAEKLTVILDWFVNPDHATLVVAKEKGFFEAQGLDVELVAPADPNDPPKMVAAGKADLAVGYQPQLQLQIGEGLPLVRVATLISTPLNTLVALKSGPVKSVKDLKGKKIGFSVAGFEDAILAAMLKKNGLDLKDVTLVNVNFSLSPALLAGQVDAVIGAFRNFELAQMAQEGHPGIAFYPEEEGVPAYDELVLVARKDRVGDKRLRRFVDAVEQASLFIANHPDESWALFVKSHADLNDALNKQAWAETLPRLNSAPSAFSAARYARVASFLKEHGLIKKVEPVTSYAVELPY